MIMKTIQAITFATALVLGVGSASFAAEPSVANTPNAKTNQEQPVKVDTMKGQTTGSGTSGSMSPAGSASSTIAPGTLLNEKEKKDHKDPAQ
jgi:hypothetical protein